MTPGEKSWILIGQNKNVDFYDDISAHLHKMAYAMEMLITLSVFNIHNFSILKLFKLWFYGNYKRRYDWFISMQII